MVEVRIPKHTDIISLNLFSEKLGYKHSVDATKILLDKINNEPDDFAVVAFYGEQTLGWIHAYKIDKPDQEKYIEIGGLAVDEDYRKRIGTILVENVLDWAKSEKFDLLRVRTSILSREAALLYTKLGFELNQDLKMIERTLG